jgi:zona occludens toxin (predicted ATPase)
MEKDGIIMAFAQINGMRKILLLLVLLATFLSFGAHAQTSQPMVPGYQTVTGCPGSTKPCWAPSAVPANSTSVESSHIFKVGQSTLFGLSVTIGATAGYVLIFNSATVPSDGAVTPVACYQVAANSTLGVAFTPFPLAMSNGIVAVFSTTGCFTKTASATAFFLGEVW